MTVRDHLAFSLVLHRALYPEAGSNACWSPFSVASALGLTAAGAAGETRAELLTALLGAGEGNLDEQAKLLAVGAELDEAHGAAEQPVLAVSNTLWTRDDVEVVADYRAELERWPGGAVRGAPFAADPELARELINNDVAETTRNLIPELLPPGVVDASTIVTLVNALYLKSGWVNTFTESDTAPAPFHAPGGTHDVSTMRLTRKSLGYAHTDGWQVVQLPAYGGLQAMVLLPDGDLAEAEAALDAARLDALLSAPTSAKVSLWLPKLDIGGRNKLDQALRGIGIRTLFTDRSELTGISESHRLRLSAALHEAVLRVDEKGFEGAAATAMVFLAAGMLIEPEPIEVRVDRPFLFLVRHRAGLVYFLARVTDPA